MPETHAFLSQQAAAQMALEQWLSLTRSASALYMEAGNLPHELLRRSAVLQNEAAGELVRAVTPAEVLNVQAAYAVAGFAQMMDISREFSVRVRASAGLG